jgi:serine/threonine protein kinase
MSIRALQVGDVVANHTIKAQVKSNSGFGDVFRARHNSLNANHAIKQLRPDRMTYRADFIQEGQRAKRIGMNSSSPYIVKINDLIEHDPQFGDLLIMDWIEGETLLRWRHERNIQDAYRLLPIAIGIAQGFAVVHAYFSHNDIKPDNIMITPEGKPVLIDFGLAYQDGDGWNHLVERGAKTAAFASPEVLREQSLTNDNRLLADVFALGAVFYYLFTGKHYLDLPLKQLYDAKTEFLISHLEKIKIAPIPNAPDISDLVLQMLDPIPSQRPASMNAVVQRLQDIVQTIQAQQASETQNALVSIPHLYVGIANEDSIDTHSMPMQRDPNSQRELYRLPVAPSPTGNTALITVMHQGLHFASEITFAQRQPQMIYFGQDKTGHWRISTDQGLLPPLAQIPPLPPRVGLRRICKVQLAVILDARLTNESFTSAVHYMGEIEHHALNNYDLQVAFLVYGAYPHLKDDGNSRWAKHYHLVACEFDTIDKVVPFANYHLYDSPVDWTGIGMCGALESALYHAQHNLAWDDYASHHVLILGSAPPYPTPQERRQRDMLEFSTDEFDLAPMGLDANVLNWRATHEQLRQHATISAAFLEPDYRIQEMLPYIESVWRTLDADGTFYHNQDNFNDAQFRQQMLTRLNQNKRVYMLPQRPYPLPMQRPDTPQGG